MSFLNSKSGDNMEEKILLPYTHIKNLPTKEWCRNMQTSFNHWLRVPQDKLEEVINITEMFYICTVIEDDILDGTKLRRGVPTAHSTFGLPLTVNSISHLQLLILQRCMRLHPKSSGDFYDDLTEGKFTLPIIHATKTSKRDAILNILKQKTNDFTLKQYCVSLLEQAGSLQYTRDVLTKLDSELRDEIKKFGGNPPLEAVLDDLLSWRDT
ncbi:terpene synthase-like isoform X4 [Leptidea sinapis]|uniref:terpene synthase-like isoform X4 n=1 Tax=Leptidea sinapis TaxID=189913 RepID=UPI0021C3739B|nr:terpene synthase-like isoform X4 [Leptidea sinapis]